jgi:S1-C subfamily serine protease
MSVDDRDKKDFEFIREQVIQKKHKKFRKFMIPFFMTLFMAILFGVVAAVTFCVTEPRLYRFIHKDEDVKTPITFPTTYPGGEGGTENVTKPTPTPEAKDPEGNKAQSGGQATGEEAEPDQVVINTIDATLDDYMSMADEIKSVAYTANKSLVTITSAMEGTDWFGYPSEKVVQTSGLIIYNDGTDLLILVSYDRVKNASSVKLKITEADAVEAELVDYENELNLAVLSVSLKDIPELFLNNNIAVATLGESYTITVGNPVLALGNPNGYTNSMYLGMITSRGSSISVTDNKLDLFNTDIVDNANSDGVIVNLKGEVIGLITRTLKEGMNENLSTVVGISKIRPIIERMANKKPRIYCGVIAEDLTEEARIEHEVLSGIYVNEVKADSPAFDSGIKGGDIILMVDDKSIMNTNSFYNIISGYEPGSEIKLQIKRTSGTTKKDMEMTVTLGEKEQ